MNLDWIGVEVSEGRVYLLPGLHWIGLDWRGGR